MLQRRKHSGNTLSYILGDSYLLYIGYESVTPNKKITLNMGKSIEEILKQMDFERNKKINEQQSALDEINNQRDIARKDLNNRMKMYENLSGSKDTLSPPVPGPPAPGPTSSPTTILQYMNYSQGAYVSWDEITYDYDPTLPNYSYTNDFIDTLTAVQVPTPAILTAVQIGNIVTSIGNLAFNNCFNLASVTFASISTLTSIGGNAFSDCPLLTSIAIPTSVTSIGVNAFLNSGLTTVTIANGQLGIPSPAVGVSFFGVTVSTIL
jgi:hypothetical protein